MRVASLTNRIFLACTLLATMSLGFAFYLVNARATAEAEAALERELTDAASLVDQQRAQLTNLYRQLARVVADAPKLKAAVYTGDPPTVQPLADEYLQLISPDLFVVADRTGRPLAAAGTGASAVNAADGRDSTREFSRFVAHDRGMLHVVSVPIFITGSTTEVLGRLFVGFLLDDALAQRLRAGTGSDIAFGADGRIVAASLPMAVRSSLAGVRTGSGVAHVLVNGEEYLAVARAIGTGVASEDAVADPVIITLRSRSERLRFLTTVRYGLVGGLILTMLLATILSYAVARTMTRPLAAVTGAMRHVAATGDLSQKVVLRSRPWDDEDARVLAASFNTLTESISRFQQEARQKERLSSLGRLSTVVAHEIRNPLMIITATLSSLRRHNLTEAELREAIADIDEETRRLNRLVSDVLDFARPIRFEFAPADLNDICRDSATAAWAGGSLEQVELDLERSLPLLITDAERLRTALVNILANARQAVDAVLSSRTGARAVAVADSPPVTVRTRRHGNRITLTIHDRGTGIEPEDMAHIFDPYFTTRRAGTGLGLPISRNIIEGLGGSIRVQSDKTLGTEIAIELPLTAPGAAE